MKKKDMLKRIRDVLQGCDEQWIAVAKKGRSWVIVGSGLGVPLRENFDDADLLFKHDRNECTLAEAEEAFESELIAAEYRLEMREKARR
ncbi:MAG: hypothetical protein QMD22_11665 [archaeon]|nr:hypothetical protein [archaeon]